MTGRGPTRSHAAAWRRVLARAPDGSVVLRRRPGRLAAPEVLVPAAGGCGSCVLVHMPLGSTTRGRGRECWWSAAARRSSPPATGAATGCSRDHRLDPARVHVAHPGVDAAPSARRQPDGGTLLCVGAVGPAKGHDAAGRRAAERLPDLPLALHRASARSIRRPGLRRRRSGPSAAVAGLADRFELDRAAHGRARSMRRTPGPTCSCSPSRAETYGMVVTEALARGLPVLATDVGGVPEALGSGRRRTPARAARARR